jgi:uncharacterized membrane protein
VHARHVGDYEHIRADARRIVVEVREGETMQVAEFERAWIRVDERTTGGDYRVALAARGAEIEVGRHMDGERRRALAAGLRQVLSNAR